MRLMYTPSRPTRHRVPAALLAGTLLVAMTGCSDDGESPAPAASPRQNPSTGTSATLEAKPAPVDVAVGSVVGTRLKKGQRSNVVRAVSRVLSGYLDAAYLAGEWPRRDVSDAWRYFTRGAVARARKDRDLLSNAGLDGSTEAVVSRRAWARLDLFTPRDPVAGMTARIHLVFDVERGEKPAKRVTVSGRLLLTRVPSGAWRIFGYDVARSAEAAAKGGR
jgi:hypothetical protein